MARKSSASNTRHNSRAHHDQEYEKRIQEALEAYKSGGFKSLRQAALAFKVSPRTLSDRNAGAHSAMKIYAERRRLIPAVQEEVIVEWLGHKAEMGTPMDLREIRKHASSIAGCPVGRKWARRFLKRHPQVITARPSKLDPKRAQNFNKATISDFFDKYESLVEMYGEIPPEHIWNMDEKGIQLGGGRKDTNRRYIYLRNMHNRYRTGSDNLELVTIVECINAAGDSLPPAFVLADGPSPDLRDCPDGSISSVSTSPSGWTDDQLTLEWMKNVFIPVTLEKRVDNAKPIVLLCDGHGSHETLELRHAVYEVLETPIIILCFPSKCTHKLQPLDVVVFAQSQRQWHEHCDEASHQGIIMNRYNVIQNYMQVREKHIFPALIKKSFKKTGLYPVDRDIFTDEDYAPSKATSLTVWTPDSFPDDIPSSDPAVPSDADDDSDYQDSDDDKSDTTSRCGDDHGSRSSVELDAETTSLDEGSDLDFDTYSDIDVDSRGPSVEKEPSKSPYKTRFSTPSDFLSPPDLIAQVERDLAAMQTTRDIEKSDAELLLEVHALRKLLNHTLDALQTQHALNLASDAHNTIMKRELETARVQLDNSRKQRKNGSLKVKSRFLTLPQSKATFEAEHAERMERDRVSAEKEAQKVADKTKRDQQVRQDAHSKVFDRPLNSYSLKDELRAIARAMELPSDGSIKQLRESIRAHMDENKAVLSSNTRFSGLFSARRRSGGRAGNAEDLQPEPEINVNSVPPSPQLAPTHTRSEPFTQPDPLPPHGLPFMHPSMTLQPFGATPPSLLHFQAHQVQAPIYHPNQYFPPYPYHPYSTPPGYQYNR